MIDKEKILENPGVFTDLTIDPLNAQYDFIIGDSEIISITGGLVLIISQITFGNSGMSYKLT